MRASVLPLFVAAAAVTLLALTERPAPTAPADLFGQPFAKALEVLGPPNGGQGRAKTVAWRWQREPGEWVRLTTCDDVVICVEDHLKGPLAARQIPESGHYPGQTLDELLQRLGRPDAAWVEPTVRSTPRMAPVPEAPKQPIADLELTFGELRVLLSGGRVLGTVRKESTEAHGPR